VRIATRKINFDKRIPYYRIIIGQPIPILLN